VLRPVATRQYLRQDAADELRRFIVGAELPPGTRLPSEKELGARLRLSRTSVREALRYLEHEGLVEARQGRQATVRALDVAQVVQPVVRRLAAERGVLRDLLVVRPPLEILAAREAAVHRSEADARAIRACVQRTRAALDAGEDTVEEDVLFHELLYRATQNAVLVALSLTLHDLLRLVRVAAWQGVPDHQRDHLRVWREHGAIGEAVSAGNAAAAATAMERHMETVLAQQEAALRRLDSVASAAAPPIAVPAPHAGDPGSGAGVGSVGSAGRAVERKQPWSGERL
jgi:GntR family transcriptional repressor for pyruvate dehydrogenase complex